ncbi:MAG: polysaccharide deacetylase family protein [Lachnospiraceae bacterium]|nr:polysaccharide deacetylase family protein [Lachnospiraceae bacterium]
MDELRVIYTCFPGGKHKVLTFSYDDGREEDERLVEIFNKYGVKGTFNLNAGLLLKKQGGLDKIGELYKGHEVACHTALHPTIERCPDEQVLRQVLKDRALLEKALGYMVRGLAYPNGSYNDRIVDMLPYTGIVYGRTVHSTGGFAMPEDYLRWKATAHHNNPELMKLGEQFNGLYKTQYLYMMYVWGHSYEFTDRNNWKVIESFCKLMSGKEDIWYATNIEIYDYMAAAKNLQVSVNGDMAYNPSAMDIWLEVDHEKICCKSGQITRF